MKFRPELQQIKKFLLEKADFYNQPFFMQDDPISVAHQCSRPKDIEVLSFLITSFAWGNRKAIIKAAKYLLHLLNNSPFDFVLHASPNEICKVEKFVYRTTTGEDIIELIYFLRYIYQDNEKGLIHAFNPTLKPDPSMHAFFYIDHFLKIFDAMVKNPHTRKHFPITSRSSPAKRLNLFLRWMVRKDKYGVDFGLWNNCISPASLVIPLDVHVMKTVRYLGLSTTVNPSRKVALELTEFAKTINPDDPASLDYALFGLSFYEKLSI